VHSWIDQQFCTESPLHPLRVKMESDLQAIPSNTLKWSISTRPSVSVLKKAIQRSALQGKWNKLFCQALWDAGFNPKGQRAGTGQPGLVGTLDVAVMAGHGFTSSEEEVRKICQKIISAVQAQGSSDASSKLNIGSRGRPMGQSRIRRTNTIQ
jgi:hypothetical protein